MVKKYYCDICDRELGRPIDIKNVRIFPGSEKEINVELCIDCLAAKTIPNLVSDLLFPGENNPQNFNFNQFVGVAGEIRVNFGDVKSLLKKHPGDFDSIYMECLKKKSNELRISFFKVHEIHKMKDNCE